MALTVKSSIQFSICNKPSDGMRGGPVCTTQTQFNQAFSADILALSDGTVNLPISMQGAVKAGQIYIWSDSAISVTLVMYGSNLANTAAMQLIPNVPSLISAQNIVEIYVSNTTGQQAQFSIQGAGIQV